MVLCTKNSTKHVVVLCIKNDTARATHLPINSNQLLQVYIVEIAVKTSYIQHGETKQN